MSHVITFCLDSHHFVFLLHREAAEAVAAVNGVADGALQQQPMITDTTAARASLPTGGEVATGWAEQGMQIDAAAGQHDEVAAKFKPGIKFKLGM